MSDAIGNRIEFTLIGFFAVTAPDGETLRPIGKKPAGLLAYLAYHHGREIPRDRLIGLLWADRGQKQAQSSLRQALHSVRAGLGGLADQAIAASRDRITLISDACHFDLWGGDGKIVDFFEGQFLEDLDFMSPEFDEWLRETRSAIIWRQLSRMERLLSGIDARQQPQEALKIATRILVLDPSNEAAARLAMSIHAEQDRMGQANAVFEALSRSLVDDGLNVSAKTRRHLDLLRRDAESGPSAHPPAPATESGVPSVDVIAMPGAAAPPGRAELFEDFLDQLVARMIQMPELRVRTRQGGVTAASTADFQLVVSAHPSARPGARIALRLVSSSGQSLWSQRAGIPADFDDNDIQVAVDSLVTQMLPAMDDDCFRRINGNPVSAHDHYILAKREFVAGRLPKHIDRMLAYLNKAIELDPDFLPTYTNLIMCLNTGMFMSRPGSDHRKHRQRAFEISQRLLMLNSNYANNHISMGWCLLWQRKYDSAERAFRRAIELKPHDPHRLNVLATALVYLGHQDEAEHFYRMAQERLSHEMDFQRTDYGELYYLKGEFRTALSWLEAPEIQSPYRTLFWRAPTYAQLGMLTQARADIEAMIEDIRGRWSGTQPFRPIDGIQWYCDMKPFRRKADRDLLVDGFAKAGIKVRVRNIA
ncbi:MAG: BTAD domain-containing putative transcriptional regulator [Paracoccus sp. (in: a-proteobacteria)]